jgi:hypothetical protein
MKYTVESWDSDYGAPSEAEQRDASEQVDVGIELKAEQWRPLLPDTEPATDLLFVDGVRRVDATLWIEQGQDFPGFALAATYAAGAVRCNGRATLEQAEVGRGVFTPGEELWLGIQQRMGDLEAAVTRQAGGAAIVVVDGPLSHVRDIANAVGYIKTHKVQYLPPELLGVLTGLPAGHRTPLFLTTTNWSRYSWYVRLAQAPGPVGGLVRCEINSDLPVAEAVQIASRISATLPRFASSLHKDPRAPQNLYPIGGLERELRRRLGDRELAIRALRQAAAA